MAAGLEGATVTKRHCISLQTQSNAMICKVTIVTVTGKKITARKKPSASICRSLKKARD